MNVELGLARRRAILIRDVFSSVARFPAGLQLGISPELI